MTAEAAFREHRELVYAWLFARVRSHELAEDLMQETFARFLRYPEHRVKTSTWLIEIASSLLVSHWRAAAIRPQPADVDVYELDVGCADGVDAWIELMDIRRAWRSLTPLERGSLLAAIFGGATNAQGASSARRKLRSEPTACEWCGETFSPRDGRGRFCSFSCANGALTRASRRDASHVPSRVLRSRS